MQGQIAAKTKASRQKLEAWEVILYPGAFLVAMMLVRTVDSLTGGDLIGWLTFIPAAALIGGCWHYNGTSKRLFPNVWALLASGVTLALAAISMTTAGIRLDSNEYIWNGQTTITQNYVHGVFFLSSPQLVRKGHDVHVAAIKARSFDGKSLDCSIVSTGIKLDYRDPASLEKLVLSVSKGVFGANWFFDTGAKTALEQAAAIVLPQHTAGQLETGSPDIGHEVGVLAGPQLLKNGFRWVDGGIDIRCRNQPLNN